MAEETKEPVEEKKEEMTEEQKLENEQKFKEFQEKLASNIKFICSEHGDVTESSMAIGYKQKDEDGKEQVVRHIYCNVCLDNLLQSLVADKKLGEVKIGVNQKALKELGIDEKELEKQAAEEEAKKEEK